MSFPRRQTATFALEIFDETGDTPRQSAALSFGTQARIEFVTCAVSCALAGQQTPNGYYNLERLLSSVIRRGAEVGLCGTCMDARALHDEQLVEGSRRSTLEELTDWTIWADKVVTF